MAFPTHEQTMKHRRQRDNSRQQKPAAKLDLHASAAWGAFRSELEEEKESGEPRRRREEEGTGSRSLDASVSVVQHSGPA